MTFSSSSSTGTFGLGVSFGSTLACTLSSGSCFVSYSDSVTGAPTITANYAGDGNNLASSGTFALTVTGTVVLTLSPGSGLAGTVVTVSGSGYAAGAPIIVYFAGSSVSTSGTCTTESTSGSLGVLPASNGCSFTVPSSALSAPVVTAFDDVGDAASAAFSMTTTKVPVSLTLSPDSMTSALNATNFFTVTYTYSGAPTTVDYVGAPLSFSADAGTNVQVSAESSLSTSSEAWCLSYSASACQATSFSTGASGATETYYYYGLLSEPVTYALLGGGSYVPGQPPTPPGLAYTTAPAAAGPSDSPVTIGSPGIGGQPLPNTPPFDAFVLKGTTAYLPQVLSGAGTGEQWTVSSATATLAVVNSIPVAEWVVTAPSQLGNPIDYQHQYQVTFASSPSAGGSTAPSGTAVWEDAGSPGIPISATANSGYAFSGWSSSTGSITFSSASSALTTATIDGAGTITADFGSSAPPQTQVSITLTPDSLGTSALNATNFFTVTYTSGGVTTTAEYVGSPLVLTVDQSTTVTVSAATSQSWLGQMWCLTGPAAPGNVCGDGAKISAGPTPASASYYYYELVAVPAVYEVSDGGSPSAPSISFVTAPSVFTYGASPPQSDSPLATAVTLALYNPMSAPPLVYALEGSPLTAPDVLAGGTGERWVLVSSTAAVSGGTASWTAGGPAPVEPPLDYCHQFQVSFASAPGAGGSTTPSGSSVWENATSVAISAAANPGYVFSAWSSSTGAITFASAGSPSTTAVIGGTGTVTASFGVPSVTLNPSSGPAGTATAVTASGLAPSSQYDLCLSTSSGACAGPFPSGTLDTNASGAVASCTVSPPGTTAAPCSITVPSGTAPGAYFVVVLSTSGPLVAFAQFTVTSGAVTFDESGLPSGTSWTVTFDGVLYSSTGSSLATGALSVGTYPWSAPDVACGTGCRYAPSPASGSTAVPAGSSVVIAFTRQYSLSMKYAVSVDGAASALPAGYSAPTLSYTSDGSPQTAALGSTAASYWVDSGTTWSVTDPLAGSGSAQRLYTGTPSGTASSSASVVVTYYLQAHTALNLLPAGASTPIASPNCFDISYTYLGSSGQSQQQCSQSLAEWMDEGSGAGGLSVSGSSSGSTSSEKWCIDPACAAVGLTVQGSQLTPTLYYYDLLLQTVQYSPVGGAPVSAIPLGYFTIPASGSVNGAPSAAAVDLTTSPQAVWALRGTVATSPLLVSGPAGTRWLASSAAPVSGGDLTWTIDAANAVDSPIYYYEQFQLTLSYTVADGGSPSAPAFAAGNLTGTSTATLPLSPSSVQLWFNAGGSFTATDPLTGSNSTDRWYALVGSGTVSAPAALDIVYYHQYLVDFAVSGAGTITLNGNQWENATVLIDMAATPTAPADFLQWSASGGPLTFEDQWAPSTGVYPDGPGTVTASFGVPTLDLSPAFGPGGTPVALSGSNYTTEATYYYCFEPGVTSSPAACSSAHTFQLYGSDPGLFIVPSFAVPSGSSTGLFAVTAAASGLVVASALFTVTTPTVAVSPSSGTAGTGFSFGAGGLAPGMEYATCLAYGPAPPTQGCQPTIYAIGGQNAGSPALNTVEAYDPATNAWMAAPPLPVAVTNATAFSIGGLIYVVGGTNATGGLVDLTQVYDPLTNMWASGPAYPTLASGLASASNGTRGFAFGGTGLSGSLSAQYVFYPDQNCWSSVGPCSASVAVRPVATSASSAAYLDGEVYSVGGTGPGGAYAYNTAANCWSTQSTCPPISQPPLDPSWLAASADGGLLYAFGGALPGGALTSATQVYDPATNLWASAPPIGTATAGLASAEADGLIYAAGGKTAGGYTDAVESFNPLTDAWSVVAPLPTQRAGLAMVVLYSYPDGPAFSNSYVTASDGKLPGGLSATVPSDNAPGAYYLVVSLGSQLVGYARYTVTSPSLSIGPSEGSPGSTVTLTGSGFSPSQTYEYCFSSSNLVACSGSPAFSSTASGDIPASTTLTVPSSAAGGVYYVTVSMTVYPPPSYPVVRVFLASVPYTVRPSMSLNVSSGDAGTSFTLTAAGLSPSTAYGYCFSLTLAQTCAQQGTAVTGVSSGSGGSLSATVTVPASLAPAGPYYFILETTSAAPSIVVSSPFVVTASVSTVAQTSGGSVSADDSASTGTNVTVTGSTASDGTSANITTTVLGSQPAGTSGSILTSVGYYDVKVTGITDGTAQICIDNPAATQFSGMQYYSNGSSSWVDATPITFTVPDTLCGTVPVADLTGTPLLIGAQPVTVGFAVSGISPDSTGVALTVDGVAYSASQFPLSFSWLPGSVHAYSWSAAVSSTASGKRYAWISSTGAGATALSGTVTAPSAGGTVSGAFVTQYYLAVQATGPGAVSPASGWFDASALLTLTATPSPGYAFSSWTGTGAGSYTGSANPASVTMSGPVNETAAFAPISAPVSSYSVTVTESGLPPGTTWQATFDGVTLTSASASMSFPGVLSGTRTWNVPAVQGSAPGVRYEPSAASGSLVVPTQTGLAVTFATQYLVTVAVSPPGSGTASPAAGSGWYDADSSLALSASPSAGYGFVGWSASPGLSVAVPGAPSTSVSVATYGTLTAEFASTAPACTSAAAEACQVALFAGGASVNETSTGVFVEITGSAAAAGTLVNITTRGAGPAPPAGVPQADLTGAAYYDVKVTGVSSGTAKVCVASAGLAAGALMVYWTGSAWSPAADVVASSDGLCGVVPVSALTGTPLAVGSPLTVVATTTTQGSTSQQSTTVARSTTSGSATASASGSGSAPGLSAVTLGVLVLAAAVAVASALFALARRRKPS
ncbi:MAG: hypothetical protein JRN21_05215 [Nitrososphaerota archaeon]|nr:hypothetical protein [Nitrososphaerota archaeon]